jgi:predicted transcriptional regulator
MARATERPDWDAVAFCRSSEHRADVIEELAEEPRCAAEIAEEVTISRESVSNVIRDLKRYEPKLAECLTESRPHHRLYALTREGEAVAEHID